MGATSVNGLPWQAVLGTWGIQTNRGYVVTPGGGNASRAIIETGYTDGTLSVDRPVVEGIGNQGVIFRYVDSSNYWVAAGNGTFGNAFLTKVVAGTPTEMLNVALVNAGAIRVDFTNDRITFWTNGVIRGVVSDSTHSTATKHGIYLDASAPDGRFDNIVFQAPQVAVQGSMATETDSGQSGSIGRGVAGVRVTESDNSAGIHFLAGNNAQTWANTPDINALDYTGSDMEGELWLTVLDSFTQAAGTHLMVNKIDTLNVNVGGYYLGILTNGTIRLLWGTGAGSNITATSTVALQSVATLGERFGIKWTWVRDNGSSVWEVKFYYNLGLGGGR